MILSEPDSVPSTNSSGCLLQSRSQPFETILHPALQLQPPSSLDQINGDVREKKSYLHISIFWQATGCFKSSVKLLISEYYCSRTVSAIRSHQVVSYFCAEDSPLLTFHFSTRAVLSPDHPDQSKEVRKTQHSNSANERNHEVSMSPSQLQKPFVEPHPRECVWSGRGNYLHFEAVPLGNMSTYRSSIWAQRLRSTYHSPNEPLKIK